MNNQVALTSQYQQLSPSQKEVIQELLFGRTLTTVTPSEHNSPRAIYVTPFDIPSLGHMAQGQAQQGVNLTKKVTQLCELLFKQNESLKKENSTLLKILENLEQQHKSTHEESDKHIKENKENAAKQLEIARNEMMALQRSESELKKKLEAIESSFSHKLINFLAFSAETVFYFGMTFATYCAFFMLAIYIYEMQEELAEQAKALLDQGVDLGNDLATQGIALANHLIEIATPYAQKIDAHATETGQNFTAGVQDFAQFAVNTTEHAKALLDQGVDLGSELANQGVVLANHLIEVATPYAQKIDAHATETGQNFTAGVQDFVQLAVNTTDPLLAWAKNKAAEYAIA